MAQRWSRREVLASTGISLASLWIPGDVKGYTAREMGVLLKDGAGISKWDLDTPALCVDLGKMEHNFAHMRTTLARTGIGYRPHAKTHKTPAIARLQIADGAVGICTAKVSEAEAMIDAGIDPESWFRAVRG